MGGFECHSQCGTREAAANCEDMHGPKYCRNTGSSVRLRVHAHPTHEKQGSGLLSMEMTSCQADLGISWNG